MNAPKHSMFGKFIWHDLAATDTVAAIDFYRAVFGWTAVAENANGGQFIRLQHEGQDIGSMYSLSQRERQYSVPSHWTPYISVENSGLTVSQVKAAGGAILVEPFVVGSTARIALITDNIGSVMGLWESLV